MQDSRSTILVAVVSLVAIVAILFLNSQASDASGATQCQPWRQSRRDLCRGWRHDKASLAFLFCCSTKSVLGSVLCTNAADYQGSWASCTQCAAQQTSAAPACPYGPTGTVQCQCRKGTVWNGQYQPGSCQNEPHQNLLILKLKARGYIRRAE